MQSAWVGDSLGRSKQAGPRLFDGQQLHLEDQHAVGRNQPRHAARAVGGGRRAGEPGLAADLHPLHALSPARNHLVQGERDRRFALVGAVELGAAGQRAAVMHLHRAVGLGRFAVALREMGHHHAGGQGLVGGGEGGGAEGEGGEGEQGARRFRFNAAWILLCPLAFLT